MHFTYADEKLSADLLQGDILRRTPQLEAVLQEVHPHYFEKTDNQFFLVLTQSCDLVRRSGADCKARYISIAPIRTIDVVVERYLSEQRKTDLPDGAAAFTADVQPRARQFLERLFNNNESSYFFLRREPSREFPEDSCAFLALSIAVKSSLHYQTCVGAKILELQEIFRAKLGWLVGQLYSRVGTEDWQRAELDAEIAALLERVSLWIPTKSYSEVRKQLRAWKAANPGVEPGTDVIAEILKALPKRRDKVVERLLKVAGDQGLLADGAVANRLANLLRSDPVLANLIAD